MRDRYAVRLLRTEEIEARVGIIKGNGLSLLLYKDARVDQRILDEVFTPMGWKRTHQSIDGNLYCTVEVWDAEKAQWIAKQDVGTMSYSDKEKGQASDSFKRACVNWGIGRELYTAPFIWISSEWVKIEMKGDKYVCNDRFHVAAITYNDDREICALRIVNASGQMVFDWTMQNGVVSRAGKKQPSGVSAEQMELLKKELKRTGVEMGAVLDRYSLASPGEMTEAIYRKAMDCLKRSKDKAA